MATRPVYIPESKCLGVSTRDIDFTWFPGMAKSQKQKSIASLHKSAETEEISPLLEISSKSALDIGVKLSAFNLSIVTKKHKRELSVETIFQASKVFEEGGPYTDLLDKTSRDAKRDARLKESGKLISFRFFNELFPLEPKTFFYDWLYINALNQNKNLAVKLLKYSGFTDIEFNPKKSINCQAFSAALYVSLSQFSLLDNALESPAIFQEILSDVYRDRSSHNPIQASLIW